MSFILLVTIGSNFRIFSKNGINETGIVNLLNFAIGLELSLKVCYCIGTWILIFVFLFENNEFRKKSINKRSKI